MVDLEPALPLELGADHQRESLAVEVHIQGGDDIPVRVWLGVPALVAGGVKVQQAAHSRLVVVPDLHVDQLIPLHGQRVVAADHHVLIPRTNLEQNRRNRRIEWNLVLQEEVVDDGAALLLEAVDSDHASAAQRDDYVVPDWLEIADGVPGEAVDGDYGGEAGIVEIHQNHYFLRTGQNQQIGLTAVDFEGAARRDLLVPSEGVRLENLSGGFVGVELADLPVDFVEVENLVGGGVGQAEDLLARVEKLHYLFGSDERAFYYVAVDASLEGVNESLRCKKALFVVLRANEVG